MYGYNSMLKCMYGQCRIKYLAQNPLYNCTTYICAYRSYCTTVKNWTFLLQIQIYNKLYICCTGKLFKYCSYVVQVQL